MCSDICRNEWLSFPVFIGRQSLSRFKTGNVLRTRLTRFTLTVAVSLLSLNLTATERETTVISAIMRLDRFTSILWQSGHLHEIQLPLKRGFLTANIVYRERSLASLKR